MIGRAKSLLEATQFMHEEDPMKSVKDLQVKLFADGADKGSMLEMNGNPLI